MGKADALSQRSDHSTKDGGDNQGQVVLKEHHLSLLAGREVFASVEEGTGLEGRIHRSSQQEAEVLESIQQLKDKGLSWLADGTIEWEEKDGLVWHRGRLYMPEDDALRQDVVHSCNNTLTTGHPGEQGTLELVWQNFWWPGMTVFVQKYVRSCDTCNRVKSTRATTRGALNPHGVPEGPWKVWSTDHIVELPESEGYNPILVAQDYSTKQVHFVPCTTQMTAEEEADAHVNYIFKLHGLPCRIVSDCGSLYTGKFMRAIYKRLGIKADYSTAFCKGHFPD
jgi:hypothetical protein